MSINFLGIQMNCTQDSLHNARTIVSALYSNTDVDYAITPECALSGYVDGWQENISKALAMVCKAAKETKTSIFLGTLFSIEDNIENCCLVINNKGEIVDHIAKTLLISYDEYLGCIPQKNLKTVKLPEHPDINVAVMICNDFWGSAMWNKETIPTSYAHMDSHIFIHLTNGERGVGTTADKVYWDWHVAWLQMVSRHHMIPVISVDNACHMDGRPFEGRTSSPSGVWMLGNQVAEVPNTNEYTFTFNIDKSKLLEDPWSNLSLMQD